jgi:hypothetical protein
MPRPLRHLLTAATVAIVLVPSGSGHGPANPGEDRRAVVAVFAAASYAPGTTARLRIWSPERRLDVQLFRAGLGPSRTRRDDELLGRALGPARRCTVRNGSVEIAIGSWPSGLYFARLTAPDGRVGFAPFVVRPRVPGQARVAVVLPTYTWQAYNFRDVDGDGVGDTWYADRRLHVVALRRPFLDRGVPPHYRGYDAGFAHWLASSGRAADVLADEDLDRVASGERLADRYDLIVFAGHEEYVTDHIYDLVERYRDLGGNLLFVSANNFFARVERVGDRLVGPTRWRDLGRPEARLIGVQYVDWNQDRWPNRDYRVVGAHRASWLFRGTGLANGSSFGRFGIEIDARTADSPRSTVVLARIGGIFGSGKSAEMTYYETPRGSKVLAAGTINFGGAAWFPVVARLLDNAWARLARP